MRPDRAFFVGSQRSAAHSRVYVAHPCSLRRPQLKLKSAEKPYVYLALSRKFLKHTNCSYPSRTKTGPGRAYLLWSGRLCAVFSSVSSGLLNNSLLVAPGLRGRIPAVTLAGGGLGASDLAQVEQLGTPSRKGSFIKRCRPHQLTCAVGHDAFVIRCHVVMPHQMQHAVR